MTDRTPRTTETREAGKRKVSWTRPSMREGWTPVRAEDHPNLQIVSDIDSRFKDNIEVGGLLLCQNSTENVEARKEAQLDLAKSQMQAVDNSYLRNSDPRMPVLKPERATRTSFGK